MWSDRNWQCIPGGKSGFNLSGVSVPRVDDIGMSLHTVKKQCIVGPNDGWERNSVGMRWSSSQGNDSRDREVKAVFKETQSL